MKKILALALTTFISYSVCSAQELNNSKRIKDAFELAKKNNKYVLLVINSPAISKLLFKSPSPRVDYSSGIDNSEVINKLNENFIIYKTTSIDTSIRFILSKTEVKMFPAYLFLHPNKDLFYKDFGNSTTKAKYLTMIDNALKASKEKSISELERDYLVNKSNNVLLKKLIDTRKNLGLTNNAELIEQYTDNLKISDFNDYQTVLYILEAGPYSDGNAYKFAYTNHKIIDSIYKIEPLQKRISFNNYIINNTMNEAIKTKNILKAQSAANFIRSTWKNEYQKGAKAYSSEMLRYYSGIRDTANYLRNAVYHYDNYYMNISADSIKKAEERDRNAQFKRFTPPSEPGKKMISKERMDSLIKANNGKKMIVTNSFLSIGTPVSSYANELNNVAYKFYQTGTKNINYLTKAMLWSRRAIELNPLSGYYDTLAHILYRMGYYEEAVKTEETAIEKSKNEPVLIESFESQLKKMRNKTL